jgi:hypothetical protein
MKLNIEIRKDMLEVVKASLLSVKPASSLNQKIIFKGGPTVLCEIPFVDLDRISSASSSAIFKFVFTDLTHILRGNAIATGVVDSFEIQGLVSTGPDTWEDNALHGTVGGLSSLDDIKMNRLSWTADTTIITITDLRLILPQGT